MKLLSSILILVGLVAINYYYSETLVWLFGLIGAMIIDSLVVLFCGSVISKKLFD